MHTQTCNPSRLNVEHSQRERHLKKSRVNMILRVGDMGRAVDQKARRVKGKPKGQENKLLDYIGKDTWGKNSSEPRAGV